MDALTAWTSSAEGGGRAIRRFVVAGASKRGWTTWTTAAVDRRVVAIAPAVIDALRVVPSFTRHWQAYGFWAPAVQDYVDQGIMSRMGTRPIRFADGAGGPLVVPRPLHDAEVHPELGRRPVLPARLVRALLRRPPGREAPPVRAELGSLARRHGRLREPRSVLRHDRDRDAASPCDLVGRRRWRDARRLVGSAGAGQALDGNQPRRAGLSPRDVRPALDCGCPGLVGPEHVEGPAPGAAAGLDGGLRGADLSHRRAPSAGGDHRRARDARAVALSPPPGAESSNP